jgi:hypothetical protein
VVEILVRRIERMIDLKAAAAFGDGSGYGEISRGGDVSTAVNPKFAVGRGGGVLGKEIDKLRSSILRG